MTTAFALDLPTDANSSAVFQAYSGALSVAVGIVGFVLLWFQLRGLKRSSQSEANGKIFTSDTEILRVFVNNPKLRQYFYDGIECPPGADDADAVQTIAEMFLCHFEHALIQLENMPPDVRPGWANYARYMHKHSPAIQDAWNEARKLNIYALDMDEFLRGTEPMHRRPGSLNWLARICAPKTLSSRAHVAPGGPSVQQTSSQHSDCKSPSQDSILVARMMLDESQSSVSFVNIVFAVSLGTLAILGAKLPAEPIVAIFLFLIVIATFYSTIFYAVVAGNVARLDRTMEMHRAIKYGNVLSEYFGVYLLVAAFPLIVYTLSNSATLSYIALAVDLAGYAFYAISGFDLIRRPIRRPVPRVIISMIFVAITVALTLTRTLTGSASSILMTGLASGLVMLLSLISITHMRVGETCT